MKIKAIMRIELEVHVEGQWEDSCQISQVKKQAKDEAMRKLRNSFSDTAGISFGTKTPTFLNFVEEE